MKVRFYTYSKRENSTSQPSGSYTEIDVLLKEGTSILNPTLKLDFGLTASPVLYNYCYIPEFNRYYKLAGSGWVFENRCWYGQFAVDVLASWKTEIGATSSYVLRSASASDGTLSDTKYPTKADPIYVGTGESTGFEQALSDGCYVVGIINGDAADNTVGAVTYYAMRQAEMETLLDEIINTSEWSSVQDISNALLRTIFNPFQYIVSCNWFPFNVGFLPITENLPNIKFGWWTLSNSYANQLTAIKKGSSFFVTLPKHPQASTRGAFLNSAPYSKYIFEYLPFGRFTLPDVSAYAKLEFERTVDFVTGTAVLQVYGYFADSTTDGIPLVTCSTQLAVPIQLAQSGSNILSGATGVITSIAAGATMGAVGAVTGALGAIASGADMAAPSINSSGFNGSAAHLLSTMELLAIFYELADENRAELGRPLCTTRTISTLSGYVLCADADPAIACSEPELSAIRSYMNGGFFYD